MFDLSINWFLVIGLSFGAWALGFLWFVVIFGKMYSAGHGRTKTQLDKGPSMAVASAYQLIGTIVQITALAWLVAATGVDSFFEGMTLGLIAWIGFNIAYIAPMYAFQAYSTRYLAIVTGYPLIIYVIGAGLLSI